MNFIQRPNRHRFLYLVRHGQYLRTDEHPDGTLTELGRRQAEALAERFQTLPLDAIWSSTMYRAEETAQIVADQHFPHLDLQRSRLLREKIFPCDREHWDKASDDFKAPQDRLERIAARWIRRSNRERHEMLVCHGNLIRAIVTHILGNEIERWVRMVTHHCGVTRVACWDNGRTSVLSFNEASFLPDEFITVV